MKYDEYRFLFPPRPESKIPSNLLGFYEKRKWFAQVKKNGTCTVVYTNGIDVIFKTRHLDEDHKMWSPMQAHTDFFRKSTTRGKWAVFVAELLHSKTPHIKNQLYIFDQIVKDSEQLVGSTLRERQALIHGAWDMTEELDQYRVNDLIVVTKNFTEGFSKLYQEIIPNGDERKENEGLVLKNPEARLSPCFRGTSNNEWQVKCRVPHKNYSF